MGELMAYAWNALAPYIASEDVEYSEEGMAELCENVLPKLYDRIAASQRVIEAAKVLRLRPSDDWRDAQETEDGYFLTPLGIAEREFDAALQEESE